MKNEQLKQDSVVIDSSLIIKVYDKVINMTLLLIKNMKFGKFSLALFLKIIFLG